MVVPFEGLLLQDAFRTNFDGWKISCVPFGSSLHNALACSGYIEDDRFEEFSVLHIHTYLCWPLKPFDN